MIQDFHLVSGEPVVGTLPDLGFRPDIGCRQGGDPIQPVVEEADRNIQRLRDLAKLAGSDGTRPNLVFPHLLERHPQGFAKLLLG